MAERERSQNKAIAFRLYGLHPLLWYSGCFRSYIWLAVSCGTETAWVMSGMINNGIAHNHPPPPHTLLPISICLALRRTASGRIGCIQHFYQRLPRWNSRYWECHFGRNCEIIRVDLKVREIWVSALSIALTFTCFLQGTYPWINTNIMTCYSVNIKKNHLISCWTPNSSLLVLPMMSTISPKDTFS